MHELKRSKQQMKKEFQIPYMYDEYKKIEGLPPAPVMFEYGSVNNAKRNITIESQRKKFARTDVNFVNFTDIGGEFDGSYFKVSHVKLNKTMTEGTK